VRLPAIVLFAAIASPLPAQVDRSALAGTVRDRSGSSIPAATVRAVHSATHFTRETVTTSEGAYILTELPVGVYTVTIAKTGFSPMRFENVEQTIGLTRTLDANLSVASKGDQVTVSEPLVQLDRTTASLGGRTEQKQVTGLPLNGRNWSSLTALAPGAIDSGGSNMKSIRFAGRGLDDNNFTLDGVDATGILNQAQRGQGRLTIPTEAISEFRVESALYSSELGGSPGGQVSIASPSGTNQFHGSLFEYFRNDAMNARSPFDPSTPPPFHLNQFGGSLGGPIVHDNTFFFADYEGYRQRLGETITGFVPGDRFRASAVPSIAPVLAAYPAGNGPVLDPNTVTYTFQGSQKVDENTGMLRLDHRFRDSLTGFLRYNQDEAVSNVPAGSIGIRQAVDTKPLNGVAELLQVLSPKLTNEYKFGFNQEITHTATLSPVAYTISAPGFSSITGGSTRDERGATLSGIENLSWVAGRHILKFGVEVRYVEMDQGNSFNGALTYSTLANFATNQLDKATQTAELPMKRQRKTQVFSYVQDEYKLKPNLTLNLGLRYEFYNVFHETENRAIPFDFATCGPRGYCAPGSDFTFPNTHNIDPRVAIAWAPERFDAKTVIRVGAGIYHGDGQLDDQNLPIANDVERFSLTRVNFPTLAYPIDPFLRQATGVVTPRLLDRNRKDMYVSEWGASVQQDLSHGFVGTVSYVGSKGTNLLTTSYVNAINPATGARTYPDFGIVEYRGNTSNSNFNALDVSAQRYFRRGFSLGANYMWSHSMNDGSTGGGEAVFPQFLNCRACERASSDQDVRQVFTANSVYELPFGRGRRYFVEPGPGRALLGGWQLASVASARTGLPVNVTVDRASSDLSNGYNTNQRPNLAPGVSLTPAGGATPGDWINLAAFAVPAKGAWGNAGRNLVRAPGVWQMDLSLSRNIELRESAGLQFRAEAFNIFNRAQYGSPLADISAPSTFGRITTLVNNGPTGSGTPRQVQLALRLVF
jgi:outer membrane receptor protein involved in Fe transport